MGHDTPHTLRSVAIGAALSIYIEVTLIIINKYDVNVTWFSFYPCWKSEEEGEREEGEKETMHKKKKKKKKKTLKTGVKRCYAVHTTVFRSCSGLF